MDRIDRQQRFIVKKTVAAAMEGAQDSLNDGNGAESASHWLGAAMAMWIEQDEAQARADRDMRHADAGKR